MGASSTAIFADDTACDVRDAFDRLIREGASATDATSRVLADFAAAVDDADEGPIVWIALALTQWKLGRLDEPVKARALVALVDGADAARWAHATPRVRASRAKALAAARATLESPPPRPRALRPRAKPPTLWSVGDWIAYRLRSGRDVILRAVGVEDTFPVFEVTRWDEPEPPRLDRVRALWARPGHAPSTVVLVSRPRTPPPRDRLTVLGRDEPTHADARPQHFTHWDAFDEGHHLLKRSERERAEHLRWCFDQRDPPLLRTSFENDAGWQSLLRVISTPSREGFVPHVSIVDDLDYVGLSIPRLLTPWPSTGHACAMLADARTCDEAEHPVMVIDLARAPGRVLRVAAAHLWGVENHLTIANRGFEELVAAAKDGVFRGFEG